MSKTNSNEKFKSKIGGQALIEGIMMLGPTTGAMACRLPDGTIDLETWEENNGKKAPWYKKTPIVRGCVNFFLSMKKGYKYMMKSAEKQMTEEELAEEENSSAFFNICMTIGMVLGIVLALFLFMWLPKFLVGIIKPLTVNRIVRSASEGIVKIVIFVAYMALTSLMKDIRRQFEYHGAEHKTIACHEAELPLTVENIRKQSRFHKRCGTSFMFVVMIISILVFSFFKWTNPVVRVLMRLALLPVVVGISYEFNRFVGRHDNWFTNLLRAPGMFLQNFTTVEPDDSMIEVAIAAIEGVIPENKEKDNW